MARIDTKVSPANFRQTLYLLGQSIPEVASKIAGKCVPFLLADRQTVQVNPEAVYELDLLRLDELLTDGGRAGPQLLRPGAFCAIQGGGGPGRMPGGQRLLGAQGRKVGPSQSNARGREVEEHILKLS